MCQGRGAGAVDEVVGVDDGCWWDFFDDGAEAQEEGGLFEGLVGGEGYVREVAPGAGEGCEGYACGLWIGEGMSVPGNDGHVATYLG